MRSVIRTAIEAGRVAWWTNAVLHATVSADEAVSHVTGSVLPAPGRRGTEGPPVIERTSWPHTWGDLRRSGVTDLRLVLPVPGDLLGLSGPADTNAAAVRAGAALLGGVPGVCLIPDASGLWRSWPAEPGLPAGGMGTVGEARRQMRESMVEISAGFGSLAADTRAMSEIQRARATRMPTAPPGVDPRAAELVASAALVWQFAEIAIGAAVRSASEPGRLRSLSADSRRALAVGFSHPILEQRRGQRTGPGRASAPRPRTSDTGASHQTSGTGATDKGTSNRAVPGSRIVDGP